MSGREFGVKEFELCFVELGTLMGGADCGIFEITWSVMCLIWF